MITKLEQSIIESAREHLSSLRHALALAESHERDIEVTKEFFSISSLVMFRHFDSGLSHDASLVLRAIELEAAAAIGGPRETPAHRDAEQATGLLPEYRQKLEPIQAGAILLKPSPHLEALAKNGQLAFKVDDEGYPEIWLGERLWEVSGRGVSPAGTVIDPGAPGPVVRVMTLEDQAFIVAWLSKPEALSKH